ncbi:hypothetical protein SVA_3201 [Sulfurifustis variabilis]|uniref:Uncharacterized protein n=1 Tax=Sulfurifustis variabilis TaxID=1675686 RepID=A0A1B4V891_9GAMM|nr:hypothetical protein [Sulfurifustis variabilis]BAU49749.1 hypothetical protein SVA_3201 [Sulfurifustis variabilis]
MTSLIEATERELEWASFGWQAHACAEHERLVRTNARALGLGRDPLAENFRFPVRN